jgi:2-oxoglutarate dehydrogenase E1 component
MLLASQRRLLAAARQSRAVVGTARRVFSTRPQEMESFLNGTSSLYAEQMLEQYEQDPSSVHPSWKKYFDNLEEGVSFTQDDYSRPTVVPGKRQVSQTAVSLDVFQTCSTIHCISHDSMFGFY